MQSRYLEKTFYGEFIQDEKAAKVESAAMVRSKNTDLKLAALIKLPGTTGPVKANNENLAVVSNNTACQSM